MMITDTTISALQTHCLLGLLESKKLISVDEMRRAIEGMPAEQYKQIT